MSYCCSPMPLPPTLPASTWWASCSVPLTGGTAATCRHQYDSRYGNTPALVALGSWSCLVRSICWSGMSVHCTRPTPICLHNRPACHATWSKAFQASPRLSPYPALRYPCVFQVVNTFNPAFCSTLDEGRGVLRVGRSTWAAEELIPVAALVDSEAGFVVGDRLTIRVEARYL